MASNSLLEGLVFARRIAVDILTDLPERSDPAPVAEPGGVFDPDLRTPLQRAMSSDAGVLRTGASLTAAADTLGTLGRRGDRPNTASWEATNLLTVASILVAAALRRQETRGCHWREDYPTASPVWRGHLLAGLDPTGRLTETWVALP